MRPINEKTKKTSIRRFIGYFLLAIIPFCAAVYLFAKVDDTENRHLREQVKEQRVIIRNSKAMDDLELELSGRIDRLNKMVTEKGSNLGINHHDEIQDELEDIKLTLDKLNKEMDDEDPKYSYLLMMVDLRRSLDRFNSSIYSGVYTEWQRALDDLDEKERTITTLQDEVREFRGR